MKSPVDIFAAGARDGVYPGGQLCASLDGHRLVNAAVGVLESGGDPVDTDTIYDLASLTKPLATTLLTALAVDTGRCKFTDKLCDYVPGVDPSITIQHVLEHSAGFPAHRRFDADLAADTKPGSWDAWRHIVVSAAKTPQEAAAGKQAVYSDIGFILLGAALEVIYSRPLSVAFALLGTPLTFLDRRGMPVPPLSRPRHAVAPTEDDLVGVVHDENARAMGGAAGHAGLFGNARGVMLIAESLIATYHGWQGGLLKPETVRQLWKPSKVKGSTRTLGWDRPSSRGSSTGGQWPSYAVGHLGFTGTSLWIEPERALAIALVTNRVCPSRANNLIRRLRPALHDAAWDAWAKGRRRLAPPAPKKKRRARKRNPATVIRENDVIVNPVEPDPRFDAPTERLPYDDSHPLEPRPRKGKRGGSAPKR